MTSAAEGAGVEESAAAAQPAAAAASNPWANPRRLHAALADDARAQAARTAPPAGVAPPTGVAPAAVRAAPAPLPASMTWDVAQLAAAPFERRGFVNSGNLCFANATLQALLGLDPFVALLRHVERITQLPQQASTPTLRALAALAREFPPEENTAHGRAVARPRSSRNAVCIDDFFSAFLATFDASLGSAVASSARGARQAARRVRQQQDAHEFLSSLLDHAHMVRASRPCAPPRTRADACCVRRSWCSWCMLAAPRRCSLRQWQRTRGGSAWAGATPASSHAHTRMHQHP